MLTESLFLYQVFGCAFDWVAFGKIILKHSYIPKFKCIKVVTSVLLSVLSSVLSLLSETECQTASSLTVCMTGSKESSSFSFSEFCVRMLAYCE
jgi:hypothetical protein